MIDIIVASFLASALGFIVASSWNVLAMTMLQKYERKDPETGKPINIINQRALYAISVTVFSIFFIYALHKFGIVDLAKAKK